MKDPKKSKDQRARWLTTGEAAVHCRVSVPTLQDWIRSGRLAALKTLGGHRRIDVHEFERFLHTYGMPPYRSIPRVMIVDDDLLVVDVIAARLAADIRAPIVESASDGYEALLKIGEFKPTLLIVDVVLPRVDGVEVCRRLKANPGTKALKILGITGHPDRIPEILEAGADACLAKPFGLDELDKTIDRLLPGGRASKAGIEGHGAV
jgi:excisionase family DNA binding protein